VSLVVQQPTLHLTLTINNTKLLSEGCVDTPLRVIVNVLNLHWMLDRKFHRKSWQIDCDRSVKMARTRLMHDQRSRNHDFAFWIVLALSFLLVFSIALFCTLTGLPWRRWLPGAESCKSFFGGIRAAVYSFMSYLL